jgi:hypothetical protein
MFIENSMFYKPATPSGSNGLANSTTQDFHWWWKMEPRLLSIRHLAAGAAEGLPGHAQIGGNHMLWDPLDAFGKSFGQPNVDLGRIKK